MNFSNFKTNGNGIPFCVMPEFQTWLAVHPDHVGFVIGSNGQTIKKIASDCSCYIRIQDPNSFSSGMPWFMIRGSTDLDICEAYHRICIIANEANKRMPRIGISKTSNMEQNTPTPVPKKSISFSVESPLYSSKPINSKNKLSNKAINTINSFTKEPLQLSNKINDIINYFETLYDKYSKSGHNRTRIDIKNNIKEYFSSELKHNIKKFVNKPFEEIFKIVYDKLSSPVSEGGGKIQRNGRGGACGIAVLGCYDITMCLVRSIPNCIGPSKIILIKDKTKGPWNYVSNILNLPPKKYTELSMTYNNLYYIEKDLIINALQIKYNIDEKIKDYDCDELESLICKLWNDCNKLEKNTEYLEKNTEYLEKNTEYLENETTGYIINIKNNGTEKEYLITNTLICDKDNNDIIGEIINGKYKFY